MCVCGRRQAHFSRAALAEPLETPSACSLVVVSVILRRGRVACTCAMWLLICACAGRVRVRARSHLPLTVARVHSTP